ncbi:MAG TPA: GGDEF domain-containing protein [Rummeliibacillus sp.]|nr:GGDEF domain-containing protein [Rummeliibacillus sp.]
MLDGRHLDKSFDFRQERLLENMSRILLLSKVFIGVMLWVGFFNTSAVFFMDFHPSSSVAYLILYSLFGLFNIAYFYIVHNRIKESNWTKQEIAKWEGIVMFYLTISIVWGVGIALIDQIEYKHILMFSICLFLCAALFYTSARQMIALSLFATILFFMGLSVIYPYKSVFYEVLYLFFLILFVSFILSRIVYRVFVSLYFTKLKWDHELENNTLLTEQLQLANKQLAKQAHYDELTNVLNRHGFQEYIKNLFNLHCKQGVSLTIVIIDIDYFKIFNDNYGHINGDEVLKAVAKTVEMIASKYGYITVRWGGEEFIVAGTDVSVKRVEDLCKEIENAVSKLSILHTESCVSQFVTVSIGASTGFCTSSNEIEDVIISADRALYVVKDRGRNSYLILQ